MVRLNLKGNYGTANVGYLINIPSDEKNSGIVLSVGAGIMQHKIDIVSSQNKIPQINGEYDKEYDKIANGIATNINPIIKEVALKNSTILRLMFMLSA